MTHTPVLSLDQIDFADPLFWARPPAERDAAFATLRAERPLAYHQEFEIPGFPKGPGYWSLVRHDHVTLASRQPELFCSGQGTQITDQPQIFNEAFGSMINMDDPRHARLRRIVSASFADPYRFDVGRTPNEHVGFGAPGPQFCLGANLARREITVMFRELFRRLPDLRITGEPARLLSGFLNGIKRMPCEFTPRR
jgi:cytochrome P450